MRRPRLTSREIRLASRPRGMPSPADFELAEVALAEPADGEVLVRNVYMSVDPYMRGRMSDAPSYAAPFDVGKVIAGGAVGKVLQSRAPELLAGDFVLSMLGWREQFVARASSVQKLTAASVPLSAYLGVLGLTGFTAWYGLNEIGRPKKGEWVAVSAAAGAVGSVAGQLARAHGCHVVGSAGSDDKVAHLVGDLGFEAAFNYHRLTPAEGFSRGAPEGIDVYFDNVGGAHLEAAIHHLRAFGRVVACGSISRYNLTAPAPGPSNISLVVGKRLLMQGFIIADHYSRLGEFHSQVIPMIERGQLRWRETILDGIERAPEAFIKLFEGGNLGKMLVRLAPEAA